MLSLPVQLIVWKGKKGNGFRDPLIVSPMLLSVERDVKQLLTHSLFYVNLWYTVAVHLSVFNSAVQAAYARVWLHEWRVNRFLHHCRFGINLCRLLHITTALHRARRCNLSVVFMFSFFISCLSSAY